MASDRVVIAGAAGDLGLRITRALVARGADVRALVRANVSTDHRSRIEATGASLHEVSPDDSAALARACEGAVCVVSALNGLRDAILYRQTLLLEAAEAARVPRFIPSDYCEDFTRTKPGDNRNLDLRREFMARADRSTLRVMSVFNGAFLELLGGKMPLIQPKIRRVLYWRSPDQPLDFTAKDDVAAFSAQVALDARAPRIVRIAGDTVTARQIAECLTRLSGRVYRPMPAGTIRSLGVMIGLGKLFAAKPGDVFPAWQGMQYTRDMFSGAGKLQDLDNARYGERAWVSVEAHLARVGGF